MTNKLTIFGVTIVELLWALAIAAVLVAFALPAFQAMMLQRAMTDASNEFVLAVNYARSEAAKVGGTVSVQSRNHRNTANEWGMGYCVVPGDPGHCDGAVLRGFDGVRGMTLNGVGGLNAVGTLRFNSRALLIGGGAGEVHLCSLEPGEDPGRAILVNPIGRATIAERVCYP